MTRWALYERLSATDLPVECGSGGQTSFNRNQRNLPKEHWVDAAYPTQEYSSSACTSGCCSTANRGLWAWQTANVPDGYPRFSAYSPKGRSSSERLSNWRHRCDVTS